MKLELQSFLQNLVTFSPFDSCYPQHSRSRHPQSMSQARKTAIIELKMVGAIVKFINPVKHSSGISAPLLLSASRNTSWKIPGEENIRFRRVLINNVNNHKIFNSSFCCLALKLHCNLSNIRSISNNQHVTKSQKT